jgi:hypothetical protein
MATKSNPPVKPRVTQEDPTQINFYSALEVSMTGSGEYKVKFGKPGIEFPKTFAKLVGSKVRTIYDWIAAGKTCATATAPIVPHS